MPEGEKLWCYLLLPLVEIGLTDLPNIGGARLGLNPEEEGFNFYDVQIAGAKRP